jgi:hypothetical protein
MTSESIFAEAGPSPTVRLSTLREQIREQRFAALADAVREHQTATSHRSVPKRPGDHVLYRRLRAIEDASSS